MARQRGKGEGSISQRGDGRWMGRITLAGGRRKSVYGKTKREVQQQMVAALRDQQLGLPIPVGRQTLGQFLTRWLHDSVRHSVRPRTYQSYELTVRLHIVPTLGTNRLDQLTPQRIQALLSAKLEEGLSPRSVAYIRAVLRRALSEALEQGLIARNPAALARPPKVERTEIQPLTVEQARTLLGAVRGDRLEALYTVALALGLRKGEALGLRWDDVDLDARTLTVRYQLQRVDGRRVLTPPKSRESRRVVDLPQNVVESLRAQRVRQLEERLAAGGAWQESGHVFTSRVGTPLEPRNVNRSFDAVLRRTDLPRIRFHDLRHSAASLLLAQGIAAKKVQALLGHSTIGMTLNTYAHLFPEARRDAADIMDRILGDTGT